MDLYKISKKRQQKSSKIDAFNLQELLVVMLIIGVFLLIALPNLMPNVTKAKSLEAQIQLKHIFNNQTTNRYLYSKYTIDLNELDFEAPKTTNEGGNGNYIYELLIATKTSFKARATAVNDFDGDGIFNVWEIDENGTPKQITKD